MNKRILHLLYPHIGKITGTLVGLLSGLRFFGLIFGFLIGSLADILLENIRMRRIFVQPDTLSSISTFYSPQMQGIVKLTWLIIHTAYLEAEKNCSSQDLLYLNEYLVRSIPLSMKGKQIVHHIFQQFKGDQSRLPERAALYALPNLPLTASEQIAVARLLYDAAAIGGGEPFRSAKFTRQVSDVGRQLGIETRYMHIAAGISQTRDNSSYELLGIDRETPLNEIKRIYRILASQFHPDSLHGLNTEQKDAATEAFLRIRTAYEEIIGEHKGKGS